MGKPGAKVAGTSLLLGYGSREGPSLQPRWQHPWLCPDPCGTAAAGLPGALCRVPSPAPAAALGIAGMAQLCPGNVLSHPCCHHVLDQEPGCSPKRLCVPISGVKALIWGVNTRLVGCCRSLRSPGSAAPHLRHVARCWLSLCPISSRTELDRGPVVGAEGSHMPGPACPGLTVLETS